MRRPIGVVVKAYVCQVLSLSSIPTERARQVLWLADLRCIILFFSFRTLH